MNYLTPVQRALDYVENNLMEHLTLQDVAQLAGFSPYHFLRIFRSLTGDTLGSYIRRRRLTSASQRLVDTKDQIVYIAFDYGFESQEAFTRAFKKQFGLPPAKYRAKKINTVAFEKNRLTENGLKHLSSKRLNIEPEIVEKNSFGVVGIEGRTNLTDNKIPELWTRFLPRRVEIKKRINTETAYGICKTDPDFNINSITRETEFTALVCVEAGSCSDIPDGMRRYTVSASKYAVFTHKGGLSELHHTYDFIYGTWAQNTDQVLSGINDFERYDERFNPIAQENSEIDIFIPVK